MKRQRSNAKSIGDRHTIGDGIFRKCKPGCSKAEHKSCLGFHAEHGVTIRTCTCQHHKGKKVEK